MNMRKNVILTMCLLLLVFCLVGCSGNSFEKKNEKLLKEADSYFVNHQYVEAIETISKIEEEFSQFVLAKELYNKCKEEILLIVSEANTVEEFDKHIIMLEKCSSFFDDDDFSIRKKELEKERNDYIVISEYIQTATELFDQGLYEESFFILTAGLNEYPGNNRLSTSLLDFTNHYIILIIEQVNELCQSEKYKEALELIEIALSEYECEEFYLLKKSVQEQKSTLIRLKNNLIEKFNVIAQDWNGETFDVKQALNNTGTYIVKSGKNLVLGDYSGESVTILSAGANIVTSIANLDLLFDVRDLTYDIVHWGEEEYFGVYLAADVIALIPVVGMVKYIDHLKPIMSNANSMTDIVDSVQDIGKSSDNALEAIDSVLGTAKSVNKVSEVVDSAKDSAKLLDSTQNVIKNITREYDVYPTRNQKLLGKMHEETGIEFELSKLKYSDGRKIMGTFPRFDSYSDVKLPKDLYKSSFEQQEKYCMEQLQKKIKSPFNSIEDNFTDEELEFIKKGICPDNYTWHHNEKEGLMQLVDKDIHSKTGHDGGMSIWGKGYDSSVDKLQDAS